ncbi:Isochorismatase-family hydrolase [Nostocoides japonicum T1-X7]|uniref:Isochorismatase-family hydrolase n=1 Tax=Nostocoides japonicum T1-X7 TaxID=1194083 RepID=A0A077M5L5_9MICO|nr:Isochorismatase-family hydrolase [Tetrasphaera japonica T1-X7]
MERVADAVATARAAGVTIGFVRVALTDADFDALPEGSRVGQRFAGNRDAMHADSPSTAVHDRVAPREGDVVVRKTRVGAFSTTDLADQLAARGVDTVVLSGISTSGVVLSTVRDAADRDLRIVVLEDGCADANPVVHDMLLSSVFPSQADLVRVADLEALLAR